MQCVHMLPWHLQASRQVDVPGLLGNGKVGKAWRPAPVEYKRGTLDAAVHEAARRAMVPVDPEAYHY